MSNYIFINDRGSSSVLSSIYAYLYAAVGVGSVGAAVDPIYDSPDYAPGFVADSHQATRVLHPRSHEIQVPFHRYGLLRQFDGLAHWFLVKIMMLWVHEWRF